MFKKLVILTAIVYGMFYQHTSYAADYSLEKLDRCVRSSDQGWVYPKLNNLVALKQVAANLNHMPKSRTIQNLYLSGKKSFELSDHTTVNGETCLSGKAILNAKDNISFNKTVMSSKSKLTTADYAEFNDTVALSGESVLQVGKNAHFKKPVYINGRSSLYAGPGSVFNQVIVAKHATFNPIQPNTINGTITTSNDAHEQNTQPSFVTVKTRFCSPSVIINCDSGSTLTIGQDSTRRPFFGSKLFVGMAGIVAWGTLFASKG